MRLKFKYTVDSLGEGIVTTHWKNYKMGQNLVGLKLDGKRPVAVEFTKEDLETLMNQSNYLKHIYNALRSEGSSHIDN